MILVDIQRSYVPGIERLKIQRKKFVLKYCSSEHAKAKKKPHLNVKCMAFQIGVISVEGVCLYV